MPLKYLCEQPLMMRITAMTHAVLFLLFVMPVVLVSRARLGSRRLK